MESLDDIGDALTKAHAAGDTKAAQALADYYREVEAHQEELPSRTAGDYAKDIATTAAKGVIGVDQV